MEQIGRLSFVGADVALEDAFEGLWRSREAGLLVLQDEGAVLFDAPLLCDLAAEHPGLLMRDVVGGGTLIQYEHMIQGEPESEGFIIGTERDRAVIKIYSSHLYNRVSTRMYYCDQNPKKHYYDSNQVKKLVKIKGGWRCSQGDNGLVT